MQIIVLLIAISLIVAIGFLFAFFWAVKDGQYDDDYTPSMRLLVDDDMTPSHLAPIQKNNNNEIKPKKDVED